MADEAATETSAADRSAAAGADTPIAPGTGELKMVLPFGVPALIAAGASLATCYVSSFAESFLGIQTLGLNPHVQAALMGVFALFAVYAMWHDRKFHQHNIPAVLGALAVAMLIGTLYIQYVEGIERFAYTLLVIAAFLNQTIVLSILNGMTRRQATEIALLNQRLALKVENQIHQIDRLGRLKEFLPPQVADLVVSDGKEKLLETHRRYIACLFCDIRNFTTVSENIEPEEVIAILQAYHERIGSLVTQHGGTIGYRAGDGLMVFFNDPVPCDAPVLEAVKLALDIRDAFEEIRMPWSKRGHALGLGLSIASGYATLGLVGYHGRADYTAIGGVVNVASRLCDKASDGQILLTQRAHLDVETHVKTKSLGTVELKGVRNAIEVYNATGLSDLTA
jgi:class 3 adenylate cyclase